MTAPPPPLPEGLDLPLKSYFYQQIDGGTLFVFSFVKCLEEEMCLGCLVKGRCLSQTYRHLKLKLRLILFFKCHIQSAVNERQLFLRKNLFFQFSG